MKEHGPLMTGQPLTRALGYPSEDSFRKAVAQCSLPVAVFSIAKRRGKFALSQDVARWLAERRVDSRANAAKHHSAHTAAKRKTQAKHFNVQFTIIPIMRLMDGDSGKRLTGASGLDCPSSVH